jgi:hypothetical protein
MNCGEDRVGADELLAQQLEREQHKSQDDRQPKVLDAAHDAAWLRRQGQPCGHQQQRCGEPERQYPALVLFDRLDHAVGDQRYDTHETEKKRKTTHWYAK